MFDRWKNIKPAISPVPCPLPWTGLRELLARLPRDREIVAYWRGFYCVLALEAVEMLRKKEFKAIRLEDGIQDWRAMGLTLDVGG